MPEADSAQNRPPPQQSPRPVPQEDEPEVDRDINHESDLLLTNDPVHQTRTQIFIQEPQFHPVNLALQGPYSSNTIQDAILLCNLLTILHNNGQFFLFRTFTPNIAGKSSPVSTPFSSITWYWIWTSHVQPPNATKYGWFTQASDTHYGEESQAWTSAGAYEP